MVVSLLLVQVCQLCHASGGSINSSRGDILILFIRQHPPPILWVIGEWMDGWMNWERRTLQWRKVSGTRWDLFKRDKGKEMKELFRWNFRDGFVEDLDEDRTLFPRMWVTIFS